MRDNDATSETIEKILDMILADIVHIKYPQKERTTNGAYQTDSTTLWQNCINWNTSYYFIHHILWIQPTVAIYCTQNTNMFHENWNNVVDQGYVAHRGLSCEMKRLFFEKQCLTNFLTCPRNSQEMEITLNCFDSLFFIPQIDRLSCFNTFRNK